MRTAGLRRAITLDALREATVLREPEVGRGWSEFRAFRRSGRVQHYGAFLERIAFVLDGVVVYCALYLTVRLNGNAWTQRYVTAALLGIILFNVLASPRALYRPWRLQSLRQELTDVSLLLTLSFLVLAVVIASATEWSRDPRQLLLLAKWWALSIIGIGACRGGMRLGLRVWRAGPLEQRNVAFYGAGVTAAYLAQIFRRHPWMGLDIEGFYDDAPAASVGSIRLSGGLDNLVQAAQEGRVGAIYVTVRNASDTMVKQILDRFADTTVSLHYCPSIADLEMLGARWDDMFGVPVISVVTSPFEELRRHLKRLEDLVLLMILIPIFMLPMLAIGIIVKCTSRGPALYLQNRHGLSGKPFKIWKFRTMHTMDGDDEFLQAIANDVRTTPFGAFLRRTSLDELPQLMNVLFGEMSIVGPRPAPLKFNEQHRSAIYRYMLRHKVKPGITGLAQVNGCRGETETIEKTIIRTAYDLEYIDNWSLWLDVKIIARTAGQLIWDFVVR
jgi:putative colanic acid biosynthesis UDP-glucose lipid carrier transferase